MRIDLVGPVPPPYGGVSVHVERLAARLAGAGHAVHCIAPQRGTERIWNAYARIAREAQGDLQHFHTMGVFEKWAQGVLAARGRRVVLTIHGQGLENEWAAASWPSRVLLRLALRRLAALVAVSPRIRAFALEEVGLDPARVFEVPAFLPPERAALEAASPGTEVEGFLARHRPVLSANAYHLRDYEGAPLYGLDLVPDVLARVRTRFPEAGALLYVSLCEAADEPHLASLRARARELGLDDAVHVVTGSRPFGPALVRSSLLLRPTVTDGDAVSVREALWLGVPVIASDAVARPEGTVVAPARDVSAIAAAAIAMLADPAAAAAALARAPRRDPFEQLLAVYRGTIADSATQSSLATGPS